MFLSDSGIAWTNSRSYTCERSLWGKSKHYYKQTVNHDSTFAFCHHSVLTENKCLLILREEANLWFTYQKTPCLKKLNSLQKKAIVLGKNNLEQRAMDLSIVFKLVQVLSALQPLSWICRKQNTVLLILQCGIQYLHYCGFSIN